MSQTKRRILFVDDDELVLKGYQRSLEVYSNDWDVTFCLTGQEAMAIMDRQPFDVLITDMRMPGMDGIGLLEEVILKHPSIIRMIMSGHVSEPSIYKAASLAHQVMAKPCDIQTIRNTVEETCQLRDALTDKRLIKLVTGIKNLPSAPTLYLRLMQEFDLDQPNLHKVAEIIGLDVSMTAKILQLVNSAFFSIPQKISNLNQALSILGLNTIRALVLSVGVFSEYHNRSFTSFSIDDLWQHSIYVGNLARMVAVSANLNHIDQDEAQMAGILHDVGKLIQTDIPGLYSLLALNTKVPELQMEYHHLGTSHAEIGAYMLSLWGLPNGVVKTVAFHHNPIKDSSFKMDAKTAVFIANQLYYSENPVKKIIPSETTLTPDYLQKIGVGDKLETWREMARQLFTTRH